MKENKNISCKEALIQSGRKAFSKLLFFQIKPKGKPDIIRHQKLLSFEVKNRWLKYLVLFISITTVGVALGFKSNVKSSTVKTIKKHVIKNRKPNIILILDDDMGRESLGTYGSTSYKTPYLDKLAENGIKFENMFAQPLCTPSRVKLMTGEYNYRNYTTFGYLNPNQITFGNILHDAGYTTLIAGKWQLNGLYGYKKQGWDDMRPHHFGFDEYCLWQLTKPGSKGGRYADPLIIQNGKQLPRDKNQYGPDVFSNFILNFLDREKKAKRPFFIYYPMVLTHSPFSPTPDSPDWKYPSKRHANNIRYYPDMVAYADKIVGEIMDKLEQTGLAKNTVVIFTADNGSNVRVISKMKDGRVINGRKGYMVDWGTRVPLIAYWKGHSPKGRINTDLIQLSDILPTLENVAGIHTPATKIVDGQSFLPAILGKPAFPLQYIYMYYKPNWGGKKFKNGVFARNKTYKLYGDGRFYNLKKDVREQHNIPLDSLNANALEVREKLQNILDQKPDIKD